MAYAGWPSSLCPSSPVRTWSREDLPLPELSTCGRGSAPMSPEDPMGGGGGGQQALCAVFGGGGGGAQQGVQQGVELSEALCLWVGLRRRELGQGIQMKSQASP